jgi:hypothetical protein
MAKNYQNPPLNRLLLLDFLESFRNSKAMLTKWELVKRHRAHRSLVKLNGHQAEISVQGRIPKIKKLLEQDGIYLNVIKRDGKTTEGWKVGDKNSSLDLQLTVENKKVRVIRVIKSIARENLDTIFAQEVGLLPASTAAELTIGIKSQPQLLELPEHPQSPKRDWVQELKDYRTRKRQNKQ